MGTALKVETNDEEKNPQPSPVNAYTAPPGVVSSGLSAYSMTVITSGPILIDFVLKLGASHFYIGVLAAIPYLFQILQIPSVLIVERWKNRRLICILGSGTSRVFLLFLVIIPFAFSQQWLSARSALGCVLLILVMHTVFGAVSNCSWFSWMKDLIPTNQLGAVFSKRISVGMSSAILFSFLAGIYLEMERHQVTLGVLTSYSYVFAVGCALGLLGVYFISRIPNPPLVLHETSKFTFENLVHRPFKHTNFRNLMLYLGTWNFAFRLAEPFFAVFMLRSLGISVSYVVMLTVLTQIVHILFLKVWGRMADAHSHKKVLRTCMMLNMICLLGWLCVMLPVTTPLHVPLLIAIHVVLGVAGSGMVLATTNIALKLAPQRGSTAFLATNSFFSAFANGMAPVLAGISVDVLRNHQVELNLSVSSYRIPQSWTILFVDGWGYFFLIAFLLGLVALRKLAKVQE